MTTLDADRVSGILSYLYTLGWASTVAQSSQIRSLFRKSSSATDDQSSFLTAINDLLMRKFSSDPVMKHSLSVWLFVSLLQECAYCYTTKCHNTADRSQLDCSKSPWSRFLLELLNLRVSRSFIKPYEIGGLS